MIKQALPIDGFLPKITTALKEKQNIVVVAEPGAGKTTRLPVELLKICHQKVLVLEPRRIAAALAADRIASENNWQLGREVGYQVRFDNRFTAETRLVFMTEALLTRRLLTDSTLKDVDIVVLDEFHERSMHADLALGLLKELQEMGRDIKIVIMSATLDAEKIAAYLDKAAIINVPGALHPLKIEHLEKSLRPVLDANFYSMLQQKIKEAIKNSPGNILVFLPGVAEIEHTKNLLSDLAQAQNISLNTLFGSMTLSEQKKALAPSKERKIILATNIAESSLTVDGVTSVVDCGLAKVMRQDLTTGFSRLELGRISLASAKQRAGRAARQAPGICYRLWTIHDEGSMKSDEIAEILRVDLGESLLYLSTLGVSDPRNFSWFEKPKDVAIEKTLQTLRELGAITTSGQITAHGRAMANLPLPPEWSHFLILCAQYGQLTKGTLIAAMMQEKDILRERAEAPHVAESDENDVLYRLHLLELQTPSREVHSYIVKSILQLAEQLRRNFPSSTSIATLTLDEIFLKAFPHRLCRRRGQSNKALMVGGRGVRIAPTSQVRKSEFFLALNAVELQNQAETLVSLCYPVTIESLLKVHKKDVSETQDLFFDEEKGQIFSRKTLKYRDLPLEDSRLSPAPPEQNEAQLSEFLLQNRPFVRKENQNFDHLCSRLEFAQAHVQPPTELQWREVFQMAALGERRLKDVAQKNFAPYIVNVCGQNWLEQVENLAPSHFIAPTGSRFQIHYPNGRAPYVEVRLQELFGTKENPKLLNGQVPLQFHLLGPNYRPQQVTSDILSFWQNTYPEVRKELRARYPKHSWPENPLEAPPVKKGKSVR